MTIMGKEISVMFSGGIDSMYCAAKLADDFDRIHLLNYSNGYGHLFFGKTRKRYLELKKKIGDRYVFSHASVKPLFEKLLIDEMKDDMEKYSSAFIWCMGCKLAMHAQSIVYCKKNKIRYSSDGSSSDTQEMVEQSPLSLSLIERLYRKFGISFEPAAYMVPREEKIKVLKELGLRTGLSILNRNIGIQPKCIPGELYYSPYLIMSRPPHHQPREIHMFFKEKLGHVESYISGMLGGGA